MSKFTFKIKCRKFNPNGVIDPLDENTYYKLTYPYEYTIICKWNAIYLVSKVELPLKYLILHALKTFIKLRGQLYE